MPTESRLVDPESATYQEFARLYRIAWNLRLSNRAGWNGELFSRRDSWGSASPSTGIIRLSEFDVLPFLTGQASALDRAEQSEALQTVLHEIYHLRVNIDAPLEPNAARGPESAALNEGITEHQAKEDVPFFATLAGYGELRSDRHAYPGAFEATALLLDYATSGLGDRRRLMARALDRPVVIRWDAIADAIVNKYLTNVVPDDQDHQCAARARLIAAMVHTGWRMLEQFDTVAGEIAGLHSLDRLSIALEEIRQHYRTDAATPFPAAPVNAGASQHRDERLRTATAIPAPAPLTTHAMRIAFSGVAPVSRSGFSQQQDAAYVPPDAIRVNLGHVRA